MLNNLHSLASRLLRMGVCWSMHCLSDVQFASVYSVKMAKACWEGAVAHSVPSQRM